jgi:hypothetical protein
MKESQLRQLIREEISNIKKETQKSGVVQEGMADFLMLIQQPESIDMKNIGIIIASLALLVGGRNLVKNELEKAAKGEGKLNAIMEPETAKKILAFFEGLSSRGGKG